MDKEATFTNAAFTDLMRSVLAKGAPFRFQARGYSMSPFIKDKDVVTVSPVGRSRLRPGEIAAFVQPKTGRLALHRITARKGLHLVINGDNNARDPDLIHKDDVLGVVKKIERRGRRIYLGLGPERALIAFLNRAGRLATALSALRKIAGHG